jgi:hypothetical protein
MRAKDANASFLTYRYWFSDTTPDYDAAKYTGAFSIESNKSVIFGGTDEYARMGNASELSFERTDAFSISVWVKSASAGGYLLSKASSEVQGYGLSWSGAGLIYFSLLGISTQILQVRVTSAISTTSWVHFVVTYDGTSTAAGVNMYVDGSAVATTTVSETLSSSILNSAEFNVCSRTNGSSVGLGSVDDIAVYNKELSASEVAKIYGTGSPLNLKALDSASNLVGWWKMGDGDTFPTLLDSSGNGNNGTMVNMESGDIQTDVPTATKFFEDVTVVDVR